MIPKQLITQLNSGRCFALVGSGPSTEMGYPSWTQLAQSAVNMLPEDGVDDDTRQVIEELMQDSRYPELFDVVADHLGGMNHLANGLMSTFTSASNRGIAYEYLAKWPIRCYMTTNYDDEIRKHLARSNVYFATLNNSQTDFAQIDAHTSERIVKIHGDFDYVDGLVLGDRQYQDFKVGGGRSYFRDKLKSVFSMVPVVVIGHSLSDPDIALTLEMAKDISSLERPTFMILADVSHAESRRYRERYNIHLISYDNPDGTHRALAKLLRMIDRFVIPRAQCASQLLDPPNAEEMRVASSLYLYSKTMPHHGELLQRTLAPQVLSIVASDAETVVPAVDIHNRLLPSKLRQREDVRVQLDVAVDTLADEDLVLKHQEGVQATSKGMDRVEEVSRSRSILESQVFDVLRNRLQATNAGNTEEIEALVDGLRRTVVAVLGKRGLAASSMLFSHSALGPSDMPELFEAVMNSATQVDTPDLRIVFSEFVMDLLTNPSDTQREYLANLSQGFFAYHIFGADPSGAEARRIIAKETLWLLDSNVLLPFVATECRLHRFASKLFDRMRQVGMTPFTTERFLKETHQSYRWAVSMCRNLSADGMLRLIRDPNYTENLFVDGYIVGHAEGKWNSFGDYVRELNIETVEDMEKRLAAGGVVVKNLSQFGGFTDTLFAAQEDLAAGIVSKRTEQGTLRGGDEQALAEAEAIEIIRGVRNQALTVGGRKFRYAYFVSTSRLLDVMYGETDGLITWFPENLYRHLHALTSDTLDVESTFDAITTNYYSIGIEVIDEPAYRRFFDPVISESRTILEREKENYVATVATDISERQKAQDELVRQFDAAADLDKPRLVAQAGWRFAREQERLRQAAEEQVKRAEQAASDAVKASQQKIKEMEAEFERRRRETLRHEEGRRRNLQDPKHQKKLERQRKRRRKRKKRR